MNISWFTFTLLSSVLLIFLQPPTAHADMLLNVCGTAGNYTANSTYASNLQTLLANLTTSATNSTTNFGFAKNTVGSIPNQISGLVLCRGDVNSSTCSSCLMQATRDSQKLCPNNKGIAIYYDFCLLHFSNEDFLSIEPDNYAGQNLLPSAQNVTGSQTLHNSYVIYLMNTTSNFAAFNSSKRFATGQLNMSKAFPETYGLVQCRPDMSDTDCASCLNEMITNELPYWFAGSKGGVILYWRCILRYDVYQFYSGESMLSLTVPTVLNPGAAGKRTSTGTILAITIPMIIAFVSITGLCLCFMKRRKSVLKNPLQKEMESVESLLLDLSVINSATNYFAEENKIGKGGFGAVYKGVLPDGREIAVKMLLENSDQGLAELKNELLLVVKLQHRNLVRLLGVCLEGDEKILVYEYVPNMSLDQTLFDTEKRNQLDWGKRYRIICGIARGLLYLHEGSQLRIIHRDLKASNVLLDAEMNPKISDFGLARLFPGDQTQQVTNRVIGTFGYMAPEYAMCGQYSIKSDVFSYGVLVLEIITGRKNSGTFEDEDTEDLLSFVWKHWTKGTITDVADPSLGQNYPGSELLRCIQIGLLCVQDNPAKRPTMSNVDVMLSSETVSFENPSRPAFCVARNGLRAGSFSNVF